MRFACPEPLVDAELTGTALVLGDGKHRVVAVEAVDTAAQGDPGVDDSLLNRRNDLAGDAGLTSSPASTRSTDPARKVVRASTPDGLKWTPS